MMAGNSVEQKLQLMGAAGLREIGNEPIGGKRPGNGRIGALVIGREPHIAGLSGREQRRRKHIAETQGPAAAKCLSGR